MRARTLLFVGWLIAGGLGGYTKILASAESVMTQSVSGGGVTVKATYVNPKSNDDPRFQIVLETHSVNLDVYDLKTMAALHDDTGNIYPATGIETKGTGHHREATLTFPKVSPESKRLELVIKDVGGVKERIFRWDLQ